MIVDSSGNEIDDMPSIGYATNPVSYNTGNREFNPGYATNADVSGSPYYYKLKAYF